MCAVRLHPDKCPANLRDRGTAAFKKLNQAYEDIMHPPLIDPDYDSNDEEKNPQMVHSIIISIVTNNDFDRWCHARRLRTSQRSTRRLAVLAVKRWRLIMKR